MNLQNISHIIGLFGKPMPKEVFETLYNEAELKLFYEKDKEKDLDALKYFVKIKGENDTMPLVIRNGWCAVPAFFHREISAYHLTGGDRMLIHFVDKKTFDRLHTHAVEYPTDKYPIGCIVGGTMMFAPSSVRHVRFTYLELPQRITYAVTHDLGYAKFDEANSSTVKWDDAEALSLIQYILQLSGIQSTIEEITQKQKQEK